MSLVQELVLLPLLAQSKAHYFVTHVSNRQKNFIIAFSLTGPDAHFFGKDYQLKMMSWQFKKAEKLHLALLDLNKDCRLKKLKLNFAATLKINKKIVLTCQGGSILLKRNEQLKELLNSENEIKMLAGQYLENDQFLLIAGNEQLGQVILEKSHNYPLDSILKQKLNSYLRNDFKTALLLWHWQKKEKVVWTKKISKFEKYLVKIKKLPKKIINLFKKIKNLRQEQKKRYQKVFFYFFLLILLVITAAWTWQRQEQKNLEKINNEIETLVVNDEELQRLSSTQPVLAREKIKESQENLQEVLRANKSLLAKKRIEEEMQKLQSQAETLSSENNLDQLIIYSDWYNNYPDFLGNKINASSQGILVSNDQNQQLLLVKDDNNFESWEIAFENFTIDSSKNEDLYIFIKDQGLKYLNWEEKSSSELKTEGDSDRDGQLLENYQNFIYILNPEKRNIYRYSLTDEILSEAIGWLVEKQDINFNNISDMSVDGDLWLSFKDGKVMKFSRGYQEEFSLSGLEQLPSDSLLIASQENSEKIVFLDKSNKRLIVSTKEGQLISEIQSNELAGVSDITLSIDGQNCFALSGSVIYQIQI
jgi:hypothetical protein